MASRVSGKGMHMLSPCGAVSWGAQMGVGIMWDCTAWLSDPSVFMQLDSRGCVKVWLEDGVYLTGCVSWVTTSKVSRNHQYLIVTLHLEGTEV